MIGKTTKQIQNASLNSIFVWCNSNIDYPKVLAKKLGREDLVIKPLSWLKERNIAGLNVKIVVDHAAILNDQAWGAKKLAYQRGMI